MELWDWQNNCTAVGKRSLMYLGVFGLATYLCDTVFLDRHDHAKALQQMNAIVDQIHLKKVGTVYGTNFVGCKFCGSSYPDKTKGSYIVLILNG
jgi:1-acyl-sn-glycerol-3-phosphate acyltransferase